jgi:hypothetical protein
LHFDCRTRTRHFAQKLTVIGELARRVERGALLFGRDLFAVRVEAEARHAGDAQENLFGARMNERR